MTVPSSPATTSVVLPPASPADAGAHSAGAGTDGRRRSRRLSRKGGPNAAPLTPGSAPAVVLPADTPSLEECRRAVQCIRGFAPGAPELQRRVKGIPSAPAGTRVLPDEAAESFALSHLEAFFDVRRRTAAEFTSDLLCRMVGAASPMTQVVDANALRHAAGTGPYANDWRNVIRITAAHVRRAQSARAQRQDANRRAIAAALPLTSSSPRTPRVHSARTQRSSSTTTSAPLGASTSRMASSSRLVPAPPLAASTAAHRGSVSQAAPVRPHPGRPKGGDEYRDEHGRKRLYLPVTEHPAWSQHAEGYTDTFDDMRRDATGRSVREHVASLDGTAVERSVRVVADARGVTDCGMSVVVGKRHPRVSRGALVVDLSKLHGSTFSTVFNQHAKGPEPLALKDSLICRTAQPPRTVLSVGGNAVRRRVDESIARVVNYLDDVC